MKIYMIWGQRIESYKGQYAPELLAAVDEYGNDENPNFLIRQEKIARKTNEFSSVVVAQSFIPDEFLNMVLNPANELPISGFAKTALSE